MADLQLAPCLPVGVMFPHNKTEAAGLHSARRDPYGQGDTAQPSSVGHPRDHFRKKLLSSRELTREKVYTPPNQNTRSKAGCSSPRCADADSGSGPQGQGQGWFAASGPPSWHPKANNPYLGPFTKKRVGVDRAYPLKPMVHRKSRSTGEAGPAGNQNVCVSASEPRELPHSDFTPRSRVNPSVVGAVLAAMQGERAVANLPRPEWVQIQRLEALGESLEEEIRRKEIVLRNKLKKAEEELRRIERGKEEAEGNAHRELQRMILSRRRAHGGASHPACKPTFPPGFGSEEAPRSDRREDGTWRQSRENASLCQFSDHGVQGLKRERPAANSNKIKDGVLGPSTEEVSQTSEAPDGAFQGLGADSSPCRAPGSSGSSCSEEPELGQCSHCGRTFLLLRLERHSNVCSRVQGSRRKVFDSSRARAKGTELEQYLNWKGPASVKPEPPRKSNWRQKHESFIRTLRQAREVQQAIAKGGNPSDLPPILPAENPDYIQCPHCSRHFAPKVAERHVPKCKTIKNRPPPPRKHYG
ncbi:zinc finger C2HC domain-containing protein 1C [Lepus europaeus]|uniref:zinc finger C2HC domain-containing protein 1C n=1 Tax=Lepus europaeus TaxID=9983 RepID=UPI002B496BF7|nr:zinc finger C2HC domain-containing protein 1C [Lepus europaeus]